jgi:hypothetical protein
MSSFKKSTSVRVQNMETGALLSASYVLPLRTKMKPSKRFLLTHLAFGLCSAYLTNARGINGDSPIPEEVLNLLADINISNVTAIDSLLASYGVDLIPQPRAIPSQPALLKPVGFARKVGIALLGRQCTSACDPGSSPSDTCNAVNSDCQVGVCCYTSDNSSYCCGYGAECDVGGESGCKWPTCVSMLFVSFILVFALSKAVV